MLIFDHLVTVCKLKDTDPPPCCDFRSAAGSIVVGLLLIRCIQEPRCARRPNGFEVLSISAFGQSHQDWDSMNSLNG